MKFYVKLFWIQFEGQTVSSLALTFKISIFKGYSVLGGTHRRGGGGRLGVGWGGLLIHSKKEFVKKKEGTNAPNKIVNAIVMKRWKENISKQNNIMHWK